MDHLHIGFTYNRYPDRTDLLPGDPSLIDKAVHACQLAYAPYSNFRVGVAIRTVDNEIVIGSNQENAAFPIGQCAERVALYRLTHELGRKAIDTMAIAVDHSEQKHPATPCGSCRQILTEYRTYQKNPIRLLLVVAGEQEVWEIHDVIDLLPLAFDGKFLGQ